MTRWHGRVERQWYGRPTWLLALAPLSVLFGVLAWCRRWWLLRRSVKPPLPLLVVGNISVGGTGKTPVIVALVQHLQKQGLRPGVITRGYGGKASECRTVTALDDPGLCGDEPVLIAGLAGCPVVVGRDRVAAAQYLVAHHCCDLILSDDGLQHYRLQRDWELVVLDGARGLGNGWRLPVGPLRESPARLREVGWRVVQGKLSTALKLPEPVISMSLVPSTWQQVRTGASLPLEHLNLDGAVAVAGIGNPQRFFASLKGLGFSGECRPFPDHHLFTADDLAFAGQRTVLMTAKDAVKCRAFAPDNWWSLQVSAQLPDAFLASVSAEVLSKISGAP